MDNAERVGAQLMEEIKALSGQYPCIGDVRGSGFFIGVEMVSDAGSMAPAPAVAERIVNGLKQRGVLIGTDGVDANVLKIRPPMVFNETHRAILLDALAATLSEQT